MQITSEEVQYINRYIDETAKVTGKAAKHIVEEGNYLLDGVQAVAYSRIRYTAGGDYKRTERIRDVITAMIDKLKTKSISEIDKIANKLLPEIYTNLSTTDILSVVPALASFNVVESIGWPYVTKGATISGIWYSAPVTLERNVKQLHQKVFKDEFYELSSSIKTINKQIVNKTEYSK